MILATTMLACLALAPAGRADVQVKWDAPKVLLEGREFVAHVEITAPKEGGSMPAWALSSAAFAVDGKALGGERTAAKIELAAGQKLTTDIDLSAALAGMKTVGTFKLTYASQVGDSPAVEVNHVQAAAAGLDFSKMEPAELAKYHVYMITNRGDMEMEFWPDVAPNCVRNYLDLCYTHFYDNLSFHRVIPGFMIQGGDPVGNGTGNGPRTIKDEFSTKKHVPGVLSMASSGPNTASCQFFVMHAPAPHLDGKYSCFGKLVSGQDVVDKIANAKRDGRDKPLEPQTIVKAIVIQVGK